MTPRSPRPAWAAAFDTTPPIRRRCRSDERPASGRGAERTGAGVKVAIIDSGVDADHPSVGRRRRGCPSSRDGRRRRRPVVEGPHDDLVGHGTACAAIIRSLAPDVELYSVRVLGETLKGKGAAFHAGIRWALDAGMDVVNMSLPPRATSGSPPLHELADEAYFRNILLVCAANNMPGPTYPSQYSSVSRWPRAPETTPSARLQPAPPVEFGARGIDVEVAWTGRRDDRRQRQQLRHPPCSGPGRAASCRSIPR